MNDKYIVFKRDEFLADGTAAEVEDAVVIRRQDMFAPPALDCYANAIQTAIEVMSSNNLASQTVAAINGLQSIADYFHDQAAKSWSEQRKLPD